MCVEGGKKVKSKVDDHREKEKKKGHHRPGDKGKKSPYSVPPIFCHISHPGEKKKETQTLVDHQIPFSVHFLAPEDNGRLP